MFTFRTVPPDGYLTPTAEEMRVVAEQVGLSGYSRDLMADLAHLAAGGEIQKPSEYRDTVWNRTRDKLEKGKDLNTAVDKSMRYHRNVCDFLRSIDLSAMPGATPLQTAAMTLKLLSKQTGGTGGGGEGEPLPIFSKDDAKPEQVAQSLEETMEILESLTDEEKDLLDPKGEVFNEEGGDQQKELQKLKIAEKLQPEQDERKILEICRKLDEFTKMDLRKTNIEQPDPEGDEVRMRPIKSLSELSRIPSSQWALYAAAPGYFKYKAVTKQLPVRERITIQEKKQCVFILIDVSGSMRGEKHLKATGVVMNRLKAVLTGDAVVYLAVFDTTMGEVWSAENPEEAKALIEKFRKGNFSGGGTDIAAGVSQAHAYMKEKIEAGAMLYRPEVVVLTDEDTSVGGLKPNDIPGTRVHGFAMSVANKSLVQFCESTGGCGFEKF